MGIAALPASATGCTPTSRVVRAYVLQVLSPVLHSAVQQPEMGQLGSALPSPALCLSGKGNGAAVHTANPAAAFQGCWPTHSQVRDILHCCTRAWLSYKLAQLSHCRMCWKSSTRSSCRWMWLFLSQAVGSRRSVRHGQALSRSHTTQLYSLCWQSHPTAS